MVGCEQGIQKVPPKSNKQDRRQGVNDKVNRRQTEGKQILEKIGFLGEGI